jgi:hypothetical protein
LCSASLCALGLVKGALPEIVKGASAQMAVGKLEVTG